MTADIELLPLPEPKVQHDAFGGLYLPLEVSGYARANVAHATAAKDAEIEALRDDVGTATRMHAITREHLGAAEARAERLAEALREARDMVEDWAGYASEYFQNKHDLAGDLAKLDTALRDHDQEVGNGFWPEMQKSGGTDWTGFDG